MPQFPPIPAYPCPHCYAANPSFGSQRCISCGLTMLSDQEQQARIGPIQASLQHLQSLCTKLEETPNQLSPLREIQPLMAKLTPWSQQLGWLKEFVEQANAFLDPFYQALDRYKKQLLVHVFLLIVLLMAPVFAMMLGANTMLSSLLILPIVGWGYLGIWQYTRPLRAKKEK